MTIRDHGPPSFANVEWRYAATAEIVSLSISCFYSAKLSKAHFQRQLNVTAVPGSREPAGIGTDNSVAIRWIINEVCAVQDVEKLRPELQISGFTQKRERCVLVHGEVPVQQAGPGQTSPRHIPQ